MAAPTAQGVLFEAGSGELVSINRRCALRTRDGRRVVQVSGVPFAHFAEGDRMAEAHAMVSLVDFGLAEQREVALAFACTPRTVRRYQRRFEEGGLAALGRKAGYPKGRPRLDASRSQQVSRLKAEGLSLREIAGRIGVTEKAVRKLLRRLGWAERRPEQVSLPLGAAADPNLSAEPAAPEVPQAAPAAAGADPNLSAAPADDDALTLDSDPADRHLDRLLAYLGLIDDAVPLFRRGSRVPRAGVLLALPALVLSSVLDCAREVYGSIGPAFYGLRTSLVAMLLMALVRIKRPEALKEHCPADLGRLLGLDRAPEVKTLRRKLTRLARFGRAADFGRALAQRRVAAHGAALGFLYIDGHVRVYHGKRTLPKAHVARMRLAMPATTDYWVNDSRGDPLFVVTAEANAGLVRMLPLVLKEVRSLVAKRRLTVVFDRGGFSPKLFAGLVKDGFDVLTYRRGRCRRLARARFAECRTTLDGRTLVFNLADQEVRFRGGVRLRQITRLTDEGHQTPILTSRRDLPAAELAARMFDRWRQENFFKYLREEYALDALVDYGVVPDNPTREVPNPAWSALDAKLRAARADLAEVHALYGSRAFDNREGARPTMRGFKIANSLAGAAVRSAIRRVATLLARRNAVPRRVPVCDAVATEVIKLAPERKHLTSLLKMVAYQAESDLARMVEPLYRRADDEGRTLVQTMLASAADIEVTDSELQLRFVPLSSPHRTRALASLCEQLNATGTRFPGTKLVLRFGVAEK